MKFFQVNNVAQISTIVVEIHSNCMLNIEKKKFQIFELFPLVRGEGAGEIGKILKCNFLVNNVVRISAIVVEIHANCVLILVII